MFGTRIHKLVLPIVLLASVGSAMGGCGDDDGAEEAVIDPGDGGQYEPDIDPASFVDGIDNPYLPFVPGSRWVYEGLEDGEEIRIEVEVTDQRRQVMGISAVVVREVEYEDGELIEDTFDWYAQDSEGNVWYLGEDTKEIEDGEVVSTEGAWEAGVDGALPGIIMLDEPAVGDAYRQEYYEDEAEDLGEVFELGQTQTVAAGSYEDVVIIREWNPLEPDVIEDKYYAPGVGLLLELTVEGEDARVELIEHTPGG